MNRIRHILKQHAIFTVIAVSLLFFISIVPIVYVISKTPAFYYLGEWDIQTFVEIVDIAAAILIIAFLGLFKILTKRRWGFFRGLFSGGYFIYVCLVQLSSVLAGRAFFSPLPLKNVISFTLCMISIGFAEEIFFRGINCTLLFDRYAKDYAGVWFSVIVSGMIFGLMHLTNAVTLQNFTGVAFQAVAASFMGIAFGAIYYRTRNLYVVAFLHAFNNFCALFAEGIFGEGTMSQQITSYSYEILVGIIPYIIVTCVLLRRSKVVPIIYETNPGQSFPNDEVLNENGSIVIKKHVSSNHSKTIFYISVTILCVCTALTVILSMLFR